MNKSLKYEIGPIRPPSEAYSLLLRFTRNCPWNKCEFCHLYKEKRFERRPVEDIKRDIDLVKEIYESIALLSWRYGFGGIITEELVQTICSDPSYDDSVKQVAIWAYFGAKNVFIQDANSLVMDVDDLSYLLTCLKEKFPSIERITSYARSQTIAKRLEVDDLIKLKKAGLTRLHIGLESGCRFILDYMKKGVTPEEHIEAGKKVKESGIELSEYVILGLGGREWWRSHAEETSKVLNAINPNYIRFRTLKVVEGMPLFEKIRSGDLILQNEEEILIEKKLILESLYGIDSYVKSDHMLNLLPEVDGKLPEEKDKMISVIDRYFSLDETDRLIYRFGRRMGIYNKLDDLKNELIRYRIKKTIKEIEEREPGGIERTLSLLLERYI